MLKFCEFAFLSRNYLVLGFSKVESVKLVFKFWVYLRKFIGHHALCNFHNSSQHLAEASNNIGSL